MEVESVRAEAEREQHDRRGANQSAQAPPLGPQEHEQSRDEREPDQTRGHGETAEDAGPQGLATLCRQKRPRDEGEEERVRLRRREDERERIERDEEQRVHGSVGAEERSSDPDERDGRGRRRDERDEDARDDRGARDPRACVDEQRIEREERRRLLRVVAVLGDVEEPLRVPVRERVEEQIGAGVVGAEGRDLRPAQGRPEQRQRGADPDRDADRDECPGGAPPARAQDVRLIHSQVLRNPSSKPCSGRQPRSRSARPMSRKLRWSSPSRGGAYSGS